jgi:hypothetical protein
LNDKRRHRDQDGVPIAGAIRNSFYPGNMAGGGS